MVPLMRQATALARVVVDHMVPLKRQDTMLVVADHMVPLKRQATASAIVVVDHMVPLKRQDTMLVTLVQCCLQLSEKVLGKSEKHSILG